MSFDSQRAREIFVYVMGNVPRPDWEAYVAATCRDEPDLLDRVNQLLRAHAEAGSISVSAASAGPEPSVEPPLREGPGSVIGPYKLLEPIGEGGFGVVFMAEQQQPVRRKVAVKVIKPGMDSRQVIARFEAERQALALMDHPNIARVLDAGETTSGLPYFVMELVRGIPITEFCDQNQLTPLERLNLFIAVCQAVQHAHQKGIIHRDLKPANILVTLHDGTPVPKVIDFGIAKAMGQPLTEKTLFTNFAQMLGTPLYMSPEQAALSGLDVDTRSDVYALGVLLYELLTGTTPFDRERLRTAAYDEIRRIIREEEPPRPSKRIRTLGARLSAILGQRKTDPKRLGKIVKGDLDWIVMKALEKDRNRRYESASSFAADILHYLHDEPVSARPPSAWYRFRKFARRNRGALLWTLFVVLALVCGTAISVWQAIRATHAESGAIADRDRAQDALQQVRLDAAIAEAVNEFLNDDLLAQADPKQTADRDLKLRTVLDRASQRIEGRFAGQPLVEARLRSTLAMTYESLDECQIAERHARRARELYEGALGAEHPDTLTAMNRLGRVLTILGSREEAQRLFEKVLSIRQRVLGLDHPDTLTTASNLASVLRDQGQWEQARKLHAQTLERAGDIQGMEHPNTLALMSNLALDLILLDRLDEARQLLTNALAGQRRVLREGHPDTLTAMHRLAHVLFLQGQFEAALKLNEEALEIQCRVLGRAHSDTTTSMNNLAWLLATAPDPKLRMPTRAVELATEVARRNPDNGNSWNTLGVAQYRAGNCQKAIVALEKSLVLHRGPSAYSSFFLAMAHWQLGRGNQSSDGDQAAHRQEARKWYDRGVAWMEQNPSKNEELKRFQVEAAELLGITVPAPSAQVK